LEGALGRKNVVTQSKKQSDKRREKKKARENGKVKKNTQLRQRKRGLVGRATSHATWGPN
jgi:hypothetical protein